MTAELTFGVMDRPNSQKLKINDKAQLENEDAAAAKTRCSGLDLNYSISKTGLVNGMMQEETESHQKSNVDLEVTETSGSDEMISKKAVKRLAKKAKWEEKLKAKRFQERLKKKQKKRNGKPELSRKKLKEATMKNSKCQVHIAIDLSFDHLMTEKDLAKCIKQVHRCYSINRRQENPLQLHVSSFSGDSVKMMEKHEGFMHWDLFFHEEGYVESFPRESIIYLTSDSENVIERLEENKYYIIGGLVDHNSQKGLCYRLAQQKKLQHGRLPIDEYLDMKTRKILSIDHVFEIMANVCQGASWEDSFMKVIPQRKQASLKSTESCDS